jgi:hypothetical protein
LSGPTLDFGLVSPFLAKANPFLAFRGQFLACAPQKQ